MKHKWLSGKIVWKAGTALLMLCMLFGIIFCGAYMQRCFSDALVSLETRVNQVAGLTANRFRSMILSSYNIYSDRRVYNWIESTSNSGTDDVNMMSAVSSFLRADMNLLAIILYNSQNGYLYVSGLHIYRKLDSYPESSIKELIDKANACAFEFTPIQYEGRQSLAFMLPTGLFAEGETKGFVITVYDVSIVADSVTLMFQKQDNPSGSYLFIEDTDGKSVIMGNAPEGYSHMEEEANSTDRLVAFLLSNKQMMVCKAIPTLKWSICGIMRPSAFTESYIPFLRIIVLMLLLLFLILSVTALLYSHYLKAPYTQIVQRIQEALPENEARPQEDAADGTILMELQAGVNYLLQQLAQQSSDDAPVGIDSQMLEWANALGMTKQVDINFERYFSTAYVVMGLVDIGWNESISGDFFTKRRIRHELCESIRSYLQSLSEQSYCISGEDGILLILCGTAQDNGEQIQEYLEKMTRQIFSHQKRPLRIGYTILERAELTESNDIYARLFQMISTSGEKNTVSQLKNGLISTDELRKMDEQFLEQMVQHLLKGNEMAFHTTLSVLNSMNDMRSTADQRAFLQQLSRRILEAFDGGLSSQQKELLCVGWQQDMEEIELYRIILDMCQPLFHLNLGSPETRKRWHDAALEICMYIHENISNPQLSVETIAEKEGYSVNYIRSMFKTYIGISLSDYIRQERISLACNLLQNERVPVAEIVTMCGFSNRSSFFTIFKKTMGMTPAEYRRQYESEE